ncbi:MAG TPA: outer membrane beta-barrel protein [Woeseiaceae bacterium]|nr:outer membrane beta-barrel protein [Woeseiaceae bacterium]
MTRTFVCVALLLLAANASAEVGENELTAFGGYRFGGSFDVEDSDASYEADDDASFGLIWNHKAKGSTQYEVYYSMQSTQAELSGVAAADSVIDLKSQTLELGGTYLWDGDKVQPYLAMTVGATHMQTEAQGSGSDTFVSGSLGLGLRILPTSRIGLRLEARMRGVFTQNSTDLFCRTGPAANVCAIKVDATVFSQLETFAGIVVRF